MKIQQLATFEKISSEILFERGIVSYKRQILLDKHEVELPICDINPEETQTLKVNYPFFILSLLLILIGCFSIAACVTHITNWDLLDLYRSAALNMSALMLGCIGGGMIIGAALAFFHAIKTSKMVACFYRHSKNEPCLTLYCSGKYKRNYLLFKQELLNAIIASRSKAIFHDVISRSDTETLINIFPNIILNELQQRGVDVASYLDVLKEKIKNKSGKVVPIKNSFT